MFAGLRKAQARVVIMKARLERYHDGQPIVRRGEQGDEMFVIIRGRAQVMVGDDEQRRTVNELKRGDVFGEMGLVRQKERTADVVAKGEVQVLAVDQRFPKLAGPRTVWTVGNISCLRSCLKSRVIALSERIAI